ncbi:hypothetical protein ACLOJK_001096 [Asimina triloba]
MAGTEMDKEDWCIKMEMICGLGHDLLVCSTAVDESHQQSRKLVAWLSLPDDRMVKTLDVEIASWAWKQWRPNSGHAVPISGTGQKSM